MTTHDTILASGSLSTLRDIRKALTRRGLASSLVAPPGQNPNA